MCPNNALTCVTNSPFLDFLFVMFVLLPFGVIVLLLSLWLVIGALGIFFETPRYLFWETYKSVMGNFRPFWRK